jgi:hypothetical protein
MCANGGVPVVDEHRVADWRIEIAQDDARFAGQGNHHRLVSRSGESTETAKVNVS